jgi:transposase
MLAELVDHVVGVDPDRDWITVALIEARTSGVLATERFPATGDGYREAVLWADARSVASERAWVIEGTASYGRGLTVMLQRRGEMGHRVRPGRAQSGQGWP